MPQKHFMVALNFTKKEKNSKPHLDKKKILWHEEK